MKNEIKMIAYDKRSPPLFSSQPCVLKSGHTHVRCQLSLRMVAMRLRGRRAFFWQRPANLTSVCMFVQRAACNGRLHSLLRGGGTSLPAEGNRSASAMLRVREPEGIDGKSHPSLCPIRADDAGGGGQVGREKVWLQKNVVWSRRREDVRFESQGFAVAGLGVVRPSMMLTSLSALRMRAPRTSFRCTVSSPIFQQAP